MIIKWKYLKTENNKANEKKQRTKRESQWIMKLMKRKWIISSGK